MSRFGDLISKLGIDPNFQPSCSNWLLVFGLVFCKLRGVSATNLARVCKLMRMARYQYFVLAAQFKDWPLTVHNRYTMGQVDYSYRWVSPQLNGPVIELESHHLNMYHSRLDMFPYIVHNGFVSTTYGFQRYLTSQFRLIPASHRMNLSWILVTARNCRWPGRDLNRMTTRALALGLRRYEKHYGVEIGKKKKNKKTGRIYKQCHLPEIIKTMTWMLLDECDVEDETSRRRGDTLRVRGHHRFDKVQS